MTSTRITWADVRAGAAAIDARIAELQADGIEVVVTQRLGPVAIAELDGVETLLDPLGLVGKLKAADAVRH